MFWGLKKNTVVENATVQSYPPIFVLGKEWISFGCALKIIYHDLLYGHWVSQQRGLDGKISLIIIACDADSKKNQNFTTKTFLSGTTTHKGISHYHIFNRTEGMGMGVRYLIFGTWHILTASNQRDILHRSRALTALKVIE